MFERRGDDLYWQHYFIARFAPGISHSVAQDVEQALGVTEDFALNWRRIEDRLNDLSQQVGYLYQLANRIASQTEDVKPDLIELEASVVRLALSDHSGNLRFTAERLSNFIERLTGELFEDD